MPHQRKRGDHRQSFPLYTDYPTPGGEVQFGHSGPTWPSQGQTNLKRNALLDRIHILLERHLNDPSINVNWLADQLVMNRKTLYRHVRSLLQLSPTDLIRQYRLFKACGLLSEGHTVRETANSVGFNTSSHFTTVFKEFFRQTPTEFIAGRKKEF